MESLQTEIKKCGRCKGEKSIDSFYVDNHTKDRKSNYCKECVKVKVAEWVKKNPEKNRTGKIKWLKENKEKARITRNAWRMNNKEKVSEYRKRWVAKYPDKDKNRRLLYSTGITLARFEEMLKAQGGVCAICFHVSEDGRQLCVDHCHKTGKIRGLLCSACNTGIGLMKDDVSLMENAIKYLQV